MRVICRLCLLVALVQGLNSCSSAPRPPPPASLAAARDQDAEERRGSIAEALPLPLESADKAFALLRPELLAASINVKPLVDAGFFSALEKRKPGRKAVRPIKLLYWSEDSQGRPERQSGLLCLPESRPGSALKVPLLLLCHGTMVLRERVPSRQAASECVVAQVAAATGIAVVLPDYPGLGDSPGFHTYCQKTSLAHSAVDILRAAKAYIGGDESGRAWRLDDRFFIAGYSEGGYAAMAALNELETQAKGEFPIEACYPMAGPFDMSGTMRVLMTGSDPIPSPYYLAFTVFGWRGNSGELLDPSALLEDSYLRRLRPMFDGRTSGRLINQAIAEMQGVKPGLAVAAAMLKPTVRAQLATPEGSALGLALLGVLRENDLYDWKADPSVTMTFMAAPRDELVPPINSTIAEAAMRARGATTRFIELKQTTHEKGGYEGYARTVLDIWERLAMGYP